MYLEIIEQKRIPDKYEDEKLKPRFGKLSYFMAKTHFWTFKSYDFILRCKSRWQSLLLILEDLLFV